MNQMEKRPSLLKAIGYELQAPEVDWSKDRGRFDADANLVGKWIGVSGEENKTLWWY